MFYGLQKRTLDIFLNFQVSIEIFEVDPITWFFFPNHPYKHYVVWLLLYKAIFLYRYYYNVIIFRQLPAWSRTARSIFLITSFLMLLSLNCFHFSILLKKRNAVHWDQCDAPGFFPWFIKVFARLTGGIPPNHDFEKGIILQRKIIMDYFGKYLQQKSKISFFFFN